MEEDTDNEGAGSDKKFMSPEQSKKATAAKRAYRLRNPEKARESRLKWAAKNRDKIREQKRKWLAANKEHKRSYIHKWNEANSEAVKTYNRKDFLRRKYKDGSAPDQLFYEIMEFVPKSIPLRERSDLAAEVILLYLEGRMNKRDIRKKVALATKSHSKKFGMTFDYSLDAKLSGDGETTWLDLLAAPAPYDPEEDLEEGWAAVRPRKRRQPSAPKGSA